MMRQKRIRAISVPLLITLSGVLLFAGCGREESGEEETKAVEEAEVVVEEAEVDTSKIGVESVSETSEELPAGEELPDEEETAPSGEEKTLTISAVGDCTLGATQDQGYDGSFYSYYDSYGQDYFFSDVRDVFSQDDLTIVNLECVLTTATEREEKAYNLKGAPEYVGILTGSSVEACVMGNNHTYDYGDEGFDETERVVKEAGLTYAYSGKSGMYISEDGVKVGIVSANLLSESTDKVETMESEMQALKDDGAEVLIACCHWGIEKDYYPTDFQQQTAHELIDAGADLIIGHHPHVLQGVEVYNGKVICYSLGNFCFGGNLDPEDKNTMIFQQTFTIVDGEVAADPIDARIIPCRLSSADTYNNFQPVIATGERNAEIIGLVNEYSSMFGTASFDAEGNLLTAGH